MGLTNLKNLYHDELEAFLANLGAERFRADQLVEWLYGRGIQSFSEMTNLPVALRSRLAEVAFISRLKKLAEAKGEDGTIKYLFALEDGQAIETVRMKYRYGHAVCVSTQVGCRMACRFCASTIGGLVRNLEPAEMLDQVLAVNGELAPLGQRVGRVVLMGSGEPLDNYEAVLRFIRLLNLARGLNIGYRHITISTSGVAPGIIRLAGEGLPITLAVSLHAPNNELRDYLMPINRRYPLEELLPACHDYADRTGRRVTFEYTLIRGVNDSPREARELVRLLSGHLAHVNLIPLNPVKEREFQPASPEGVRRFARLLGEGGIPATIRRELGGDIDAACGQLRRKVLAEARLGDLKDATDAEPK